MFYLEDQNNDLLIGDPLEMETFFMKTDEEKVEANGKDPAKEKTTSEASDSESAEETEEAKEAAPSEESPAEEVVEEVAEESSPKSIEGEPVKPELDPEEAAYVAQQTNIYQATYFDMRKDLPKFRSGDTVSVGYRVIEGGRSRIQNFDGVVIKISSGHGMDKTFTVRKVSGGIGVERIFPLHSPNIQSIKVLKEGKVRRAKLYYLRSRVGKATRIKERPSQ